MWGYSTNCAFTCSSNVTLEYQIYSYNWVESDIKTPPETVYKQETSPNAIRTIEIFVRCSSQTGGIQSLWTDDDYPEKKILQLHIWHSMICFWYTCLL